MSQFPNPYAPPESEFFPPILPGSRDSLALKGPLQISGVPTERDIRQFLLLSDHVGYGFLAMLGVIVGLLLTFVALASSSIAGTLIALGGFGILIIAIAVSTVPYRALVFKTANPHWHEPIQVKLSTDGVHMRRSNAAVFFRWDWFGGAIMTKDLVAFLPATQPSQPLLVNPSMLERLDDWERLLQVAASLGIVTDQDPMDPQKRERNLRILRSQRLEKATVPVDAIRFAGFLTQEQFSQLPVKARRKDKPLRSQLVIAGLFSSGCAILIGVSNLAFRQFAFLPMMLISYVALMLIGFLVRRFRGYRQRDSVIYYLQAYATEASIISDFEITSTELPWSELDLVRRSSASIALQRRSWTQFIVASRDMFADETDWQHFNERVDRKCGAATLGS
jgi:hypothetical protein